MKLISFFVCSLMAAALLGSPNDTDTWLSEEIVGYCEEIGQEYMVCPELLEAIIEHESSGKIDAKNGNCVGLMQVNEIYHKERADRLGVTIKDAYGNILVGVDLLVELGGEEHNLPLALGKYHGEKNVASRTEKGNYSSYVKGILARSAELERVHGK